MVDYKPIGRQFAAEMGLDWGLADRLVQQESQWVHFLPNGQVLTSKAGALGLTQLMPPTAAGLGVNPRDPIQNLRGGFTYLKQMLTRYKGNVARALVGYNAGPGFADSWRGTRLELTGPYTETRKYLDAILGPTWDGFTGVPGGPGSPDEPTNPGMMSSIQQWIQQAIAAGGKTGQERLKAYIIEQHAPWIMLVTGIVILGMGIFALVMKSPPGQTALDIGMLFPQTRGAAVMGKVASR